MSCLPVYQFTTTLAALAVAVAPTAVEVAAAVAAVAPSAETASPEAVEEHQQPHTIRHPRPCSQCSQPNLLTY